jgi:hypothetical protein
MGHEIEFSRTKFRPQLTPPRRSLPTSSADGGTGCLRPELTHVTERPWKTENTRMVGQQLQSILAAQSEFTGLPVFLPLKQLRDFCLTDSSLLRAGAEPLARGFYCFLSILPDQTTVSLLCRTCVHVHTHTHTHIRCVQTVYEIPLLPNNKTANETSLNTNRSSVNCWLRILVIYHWGAGLAVTEPIRDTGENVLQYSFVTGNGSSSTVTATFCCLSHW